MNNRIDVINEYQNDLVEWRRDFHMHPETGFTEVRTSRRIVEILNNFKGVEVLSGFCKTAVIATLVGKEDGPIIGLRADIDALPLVDQKDVEYRSKNPGKCHACGHDMHTTTALGVLRYYSEHIEELNGTLKVIFQPAEEGPAPGGAKLVVETGKVDDVDAFIGFHTNPDHEVGTLLLRRNEMLASADNFTIIIKGTGGHGAYPHQTKDSLSTAVEVYSKLQFMLTREVDPVKATALSVCSINGGTPKGTNVIPHSTSMSGTFRTFDNDIRLGIIDRIKEILESVCTLNNCTYEMDIATVSIPLYNDDDLVDIFEEVGNEIIGKDKTSYMKFPEMGYDDFAYYGLKAKAAYLYLGTTKKEDIGKFTFHQPLFDIDETCMPIAVNLLTNIIDEVIEKGVK